MTYYYVPLMYLMTNVGMWGSVRPGGSTQLKGYSVCRSSRQQDAACDLEFMATVKLFTMVVILALDINLGKATFVG
jgi:hypothetical protein